MEKIAEIKESLTSKQNAVKPYVTFEQKILTYGELATRVEQITALFAAKKVINCSRIVICSDNDEVVISFAIAALLNGVTSVILSPDIKIGRAISLIDRIQPDLIVIDDKLESQWQLGTRFQVFPIRQTVSASSTSLLARFKRTAKSLDWLSDISTFGKKEPNLEIKKDQIAFINFTSGSTAQPKGVQISYHNLFVHLETFGKKFGYDENSRILNNMLLAHADGLLQGPILTLYFNAQLYRPCGMEIQQLEAYLNTIYREQITHGITVPTILSLIDRLTTHDDYFEHDDFKCLISVAGAIDPNLWSRLEHRFKLKLCNIYGLTETVLGGIFCGPDPASYRLGSIGKPLDMEILIVDENGNPVAEDREGELLLSGENVFVGYYGDSDGTAKTFNGKWFCTGDIARQDPDGFVYICGRKKETIISGGFNIHPAEINEALLTHVSVAEVATVGFPDRDWQEIVVSAVVCQPQCEPSEIDLINHCRKLLEEKKVPKRIVFLESLPRGDAGKVQIPQLKELLRSQSNKANRSLTLESFLTTAAQVFQVDRQQLSLSDRSGKVPGWDSLAHLNLILSIERAADVNLSVGEIVSIESLGDLWEIINQKCK
jgi:long-chain acyl-CoA synthetase